jgi:ATP-dependent Clp protease adaptor protein ClpS
LIFINLIPYKKRSENFGSDGYILWKLIIQKLYRRPFVYPDTSATFSTKTSLLGLNDFIPPGFEVGIEILNDNTTTMGFVVGTLSKNLGIDREEAIEMMLNIHKNGGLLIPLKSYELAKEVSSAICDEAKREGFNLVCRAVLAQPLYGLRLSRKKPPQ